MEKKLVFVLITILVLTSAFTADSPSLEIGGESPVFYWDGTDRGVMGWACNAVEYGVLFCYGRTDDNINLKDTTEPQNSSVKAQPYFLINGVERGTGSCAGGLGVKNSAYYTMSKGDSYQFKWRVCY